MPKKLALTNEALIDIGRQKSTKSGRILRKKGNNQGRHVSRFSAFLEDFCRFFEKADFFADF